ncbi:MAG: glycosyltransferase family 4 protein [Bacteriovoracaceae bacterium]|nr:glycosyltransferase family 4 protein [Bacteriovoracaceae bacterium]
MKKILISQKDLHATKSGVPRIVHQQLRYFSERGHSPYAIAERIDKDAVLDSGGIPYKTFRWPISGFYRRINYQNRVNKAIKKLSPDLVIGHGDIVHQDICYIHNCVHLAYELINGKKIPDDHEVAKIHSEILTSQLFKVIVCNSQMMKNDLIKRFGVPESKIEVLYPMYTSEKFNLESGNRESKRSELGLDDSEVVLGFITSGNFKKRNLDLVIDAVSDLEDKLKSKIKVLVAGKDKVEKYKDKISSRGLEDKFLFVPSIDRVEDYYAACDIFTLPAHIEEFGLSIMEAMACGRPVITTNMTGASELIEGDSRDFILNKKTSEEFAQKLSVLIENDQLRTELGKVNAEVAKKHSDKSKLRDFGQLLSKYNLEF